MPVNIRLLFEMDFHLHTVPGILPCGRTESDGTIANNRRSSKDHPGGWS